MRDYPPAHVIHEVGCGEAPPGLIAFRAASLIDWPTARPHRCFSSATVAGNAEVVAEPVTYDRHAYAPSTIWPKDAARALCRTCRGTHPDEPVDLAAFLSAGRAS